MNPVEHGLILLRYAGQYNDKPEVTPGFIVGVLLVIAALWGYLEIKVLPWRRGRFPKYIPANQTNFLEAFRCLAAIMIRKEKAGMADQVNLLASYIMKNFPEFKLDSRRVALGAMQGRVDEASILFWLKRKANQSQKLQLMDLLADLAYFNQFCTSGERKMIYRVGDSLDLDHRLVDSILSVREKRAYEYRAATEERHRRAQEQRAKVRQYSHKELALKILGVDASVDFAQVKKAYRKLAKEFHPDKFASLGEGQMKMATERFVEIQKAYEVLERVMA